MKFEKKKINLMLVGIIIILLIIILVVDDEKLTSLFVSYDDYFVINEINVLSDDSNEIINDEEVILEDSTSNPILLSNIASNDYWAWPTDSNYVITSAFGYRWGRLHGAIDIGGTGYGSNIYAANNGVITTVKSGCFRGYTSCNGGGGNYIAINHNSNNYYTIYMHLKDIYVSEGQVVSRGQIIGTMGNTGNVVPVPTASSPYLGTHLHFGLYIGEPYHGGYAINPMRLY